METNLAGRLRNTSLPASHGLMPLFEAVANSIHAIEDAGLSSEEGRISIEILREQQPSIDLFPEERKRGPEAKGDIVGFMITDNGIGFDDNNINSFRTLDSDYKAIRGGRGVGRLLWLKAFQNSRIDSTYLDNENILKNRKFVFRAPSGVQDEEITDARDQYRRTSIHLDSFVKRYRDASPKTAKPIGDSLFEHCLWYYVRDGGAPKIEVVDDDTTVNLNTVYDEHMVSSAELESVELNGVSFELIHLKLRANANKQHMAAYCASNRVVQEESLRGKIPGLYGNLSDEEGKFSYQCFVSSPRTLMRMSAQNAQALT
jgi:hypothetical protein